LTTDLLAVPSTDPVDIYRVRDGIYAADMLLTAIVHLDLFSRLAEEPATVEEICRSLHTTARPTDDVLDLGEASRDAVLKRAIPVVAAVGTLMILLRILRR